MKNMGALKLLWNCFLEPYEDSEQTNIQLWEKYHNKKLSAAVESLILNIYLSTAAILTYCGTLLLLFLLFSVWLPMPAKKPTYLSPI